MRKKGKKKKEEGGRKKKKREKNKKGKMKNLSLLQLSQAVCHLSDQIWYIGFVVSSST